MAKTKTTAAEILVCDKCGGPLNDIGLAMVFWWLDESGKGRPTVTKLVLGHKRPECSQGPQQGERSAELFWYASAAAGVNRLAAMTLDYELTAEQLERLIEVAWAVPSIATPDEAKSADRFDSVKLA